MSEKPAPTKRDPNTLPVYVRPGDDPDRAVAETAAGGIASNARTMQMFGNGGMFGPDELSLTGCIEALRNGAQAVHGGDLAGAETMLTAQAVALDSIFGALAQRAALNLGESLEATERYMRLALKAQGQCRATLETLAAIKNPPVVFARQANINNGGQQQVNNGAPGAGQDTAHAANKPTALTGLLEASDGKWLDPGATRAAGGADPELATVGEVNRPAQR
jgi:hypothetical protein